MKTLEYSAGYRKALMDLHTALSKWEPSFRSGRRNNVKNVVLLLECILDNPDTFAAYVDETPIWFRPKPKAQRKRAGILHRKRMARFKVN